MAETMSPQSAEQPEQAQAAITETQKALLRASFARLEPAVELFVAVFYRRLFDVAPEVKPLFPGDMTEQHRRLASLLKLAVSSVSRFEEMIPTLKLLGVKHRAYGVEASHYGAVGESLLWSIEQSFGEDFTPELRDAWTCLYTVIAETMHGAE